jgi:hypothetical protein
MEKQGVWNWLCLATIFIIAVVLDIYLVRGRHRYRQLRREYNEAKNIKQVSRLELIKRAFYLDSLKKGWSNMHAKWMENTARRQKLIIVAELALIAIWALIISRNYLNMDPRIVPIGREFGSVIQANNLWIQFQKCGWCAVWNGSQIGGYPAFADAQGSMLHPIVMITTLIWGVVNGAKITFLLSLWFAGLAQWWIAHSLKLGWIARLWSAAIAVAGGYLVGRMELGVIGVVLSTAMSSLMLAAILHLAVKGGRRAVVLLAILAASAILSGQGYMEAGLIGVIPATIFLLFDDTKRIKPIWKDYLLATGMALLLASPFLIPFLHFSPNFAKPMDPEFTSAQPLAYLPLNLVIDDMKYYQGDILGKLPYPYMYNLYIGWIPVLLAIFGFSKGRAGNRKLLWFMGSGATLAFLIGSAVVLKWLLKIWSGAAAARFPSLIAGLAVPLILGVSAYGLEELLSLSSHWPSLSLEFSESSAPFKKWQIPIRWLLFIPIFFSILSVYRFSQAWTTTMQIGDDVDHVLTSLKTNSIEWVEPPFGEHYFIQPAIEAGLKISPSIMTWSWRNREPPTPMLYASRQGIPPGMVNLITTTPEGISIYSAPSEQYATVVHNNTQESCKAVGSGGEIEVDCNAMQAGQLVVKENMWTGWYAWMDGRPVPLLGTDWLEINAPAGKHTFVFRYLPWDVPLGLALFVLGIGACVWLWLKPVKLYPA